VPTRIAAFGSVVVLCGICLTCCGLTGRPVEVTHIPAARPRPVPAPSDAFDGQREEGAESPGDAVKFYLLKRTGGAPLPAEKLLEARRHKYTMPAYSVALHRAVMAPSLNAEREANLGSWRSVGPGNLGGRTRSFLIRPGNANIMYAGAVAGGVWKTTDGGKTWNPLADLLPTIAVSALAMDPNNPDTLYAGTGESYAGDGIRGVGIFKTTDGGTHWTQLSGTANQGFYYVNKIVVSPNNSRNLYAATWFGVYVSTNGGTTWSLALDESGDTQPGCQDLVIRTDQTADYLFASCALDGYDAPSILRNTDAAGAGKWQVVFTADKMARTSLALAPSNQGVVYAAASSSEDGNYNGGLLAVYRSSSNGDSDSWNAQVTNQDPTLLNTLLFSDAGTATDDVCNGGTASFRNQGDYDNVIAVDPINPDVVWVGGIDLFRSDDGGHNWGIAGFSRGNAPQYVHADNHAIVFAPGYDGAGNQTLFVTDDGGIYRTDNALAATATGSQATCSPYPTSIVWNSSNGGYTVTQFYSGAVYPGASIYLGGTQDNDTVYGADATGPLGWAIAEYTGDGGSVIVDPTDPNTYFVVWANQGSSGSIQIDKTTDGGSSYSSASKGITEKFGNFLFIAPLVMDPVNSKRLYTGGKTLWRTSDGAKTWTAASAVTSTAAGSISAIGIATGDPTHVAFGTEQGFVFTNKAALTADKTVTWPSTQPRSGFLSALAFDPSNVNIVYATYSSYKNKAADAHVYKSTDGGATWKASDGAGTTGLPDIPVDTILVDPQNSTQLYIGTDIGLFSSNDGGATWSRDSNPFADAPIEALVLDRSAGQSNLIAFTHGRGVWKTALPGSGAACQYTIADSPVEFPAIGSSATFKVTTGATCAWSAVSTNPDFAIHSPAAGRGNGSFTVTSQYVNIYPQPDTTQVLVQNHSIPISQDAPLTASGNDDAATPFAFGALPSVVVEDTSGATESKSDPVHSCTKSADFKSVWFTLKPATTGQVTITLQDIRQDNGADAGAVLTAYPLVNGVRGAEVVCYVFPQTSVGNQLAYVFWPATAGVTYLVEVSATTSGAPAGGTVMGGNLAMWATTGKP
jgi:photosystem II stability/assembly factor-like uncharacterized protein